MRMMWGILTFLVFLLIGYLVINTVISVGWLIGWGLVSILVFLFLVEALKGAFGLGIIGAIILALILMELFMW